MKYTSSEANKLLRTLETKRSTIKSREDKSAKFLVSVGENIEEVRPEYDFKKTQNELEELNQKIRTVKHAINVFNTTHTLPGFDDMTIDQVLVYLPQLTEQVRKLKTMAEALPRERHDSFRANFVDYLVSNFDSSEAEAEYDKARAKLNALQLALDAVNSSETMEIDVSV